MNPKARYQLLCSNESLKGKIQGGFDANFEITLLGMASRIIERSKEMKDMRLDRFTITLVLKKSPAKKKKS